VRQLPKTDLAVIVLGGSHNLGPRLRGDVLYVRVAAAPTCLSSTRPATSSFICARDGHHASDKPIHGDILLSATKRLQCNFIGIPAPDIVVAYDVEPVVAVKVRDATG
jgi:hypothetical protein